jgi:hypothetical protein
MPGLWTARADYPLAGFAFAGLVFLGAAGVDQGGALARFCAATSGLLLLIDLAWGIAGVAAFNRGYPRLKPKAEGLIAAAAVALAGGGGALFMPRVPPIPSRVIRRAASDAFDSAYTVWQRIHVGQKRPCDPKKDNCLEESRPTPPPTDG